MKFTNRLIKHLLMYLLVLLPLELIGIVLLGLILPFIPRNAEKLPRAVRWFDNYSSFSKGEYPLGDGLMGDLDYRKSRNSQYGQWDSISFFKIYYERFVWLALRNPLNYFQYVVVGAPKFKQTVHSWDFNVGDDSKEGYSQTEADNGYYEYYYIKAYTVVGKKKCIRFRMGWKLSSRLNGGDYYQWVLIFNPITSYTGI